MGATNIELVYDGDLSRKQVEEKITEQRAHDRDYNGHQEGYSGDWQTILDIHWEAHKEFPNVNAAIEYCLDNTDKREAMAVKAWNEDQSKRLWVIAGWAAE